jgi:glutaredoxin
MTKKAKLYSTESCPNCKVAQTILTVKGYEVDYIVIGRDVTKEDFWAKNPTVRSVPFVVLEEGGMFEGLPNLRKYLN